MSVDRENQVSRNPAGHLVEPDQEPSPIGPRHMRASTTAGPEHWATHRLVSIVARLTERRLNRQLARLKLTQGALDALEAVAELEPATASEVAELLCVSRQSLGKVLRRLQGLGYLAKEPAPDARSANIRLTQAGRAALATAKNLVESLPEAEADVEFRHQLEQHISQLRTSEHSPLPHRRAAPGHHQDPESFQPQQIIRTATHTENGAHKWLQPTALQAPKPTSRKRPRQ